MSHPQEDKAGLAAVGTEWERGGNHRHNFGDGFEFSGLAVQCVTSLGDADMAIAVGQQTIVPDFNETLRQDMQSEPADELRQRERHHFFS